MPYEYKALRGRIVEKYDSQSNFAKVLGVSENSLSLKMNGKTGFSQSDIVKWQELLDIQTADIGHYFFT